MLLQGRHPSAWAHVAEHRCWTAVNEVAGDAQHAAQCGEVEVAVELLNGLTVLMAKLTARCPEAAHTTCQTQGNSGQSLLHSALLSTGRTS